jgi:predicted DNA-binding protein (MmcQ/YjbR family)
MKTHKEIEEYILTMPGARLDYPFGDEVAVYKAANDKMFALIQEGSSPVKLSLKGDPQLNQLLRERYESVQPGWHLNKKHWNTVLVTGQLSDDELQDLIRHSFELVNSETPAVS